MLQSSQQPGMIHCDLSCQTFWRHSDDLWSPRLVQGFSLGWRGSGCNSPKYIGSEFPEQRSTNRVLTKYWPSTPRSQDCLVITPLPKVPKWQGRSDWDPRASPPAKNPVSKRKINKTAQHLELEVVGNSNFPIVWHCSNVCLSDSFSSLGMIAPKLTLCD